MCDFSRHPDLRGGTVQFICGHAHHPFWIVKRPRSDRQRKTRKASRRRLDDDNVGWREENPSLIGLVQVSTNLIYCTKWLSFLMFLDFNLNGFKTICAGSTKKNRQNISKLFLKLFYFKEIFFYCLKIFFVFLDFFQNILSFFGKIWRNIWNIVFQFFLKSYIFKQILYTFKIVSTHLQKYAKVALVFGSAQAQKGLTRQPLALQNFICYQTRCLSEAEALSSSTWPVAAASLAGPGAQPACISWFKQVLHTQLWASCINSYLVSSPASFSHLIHDRFALASKSLFWEGPILFAVMDVFSFLYCRILVLFIIKNAFFCLRDAKYFSDPYPWCSQWQLWKSRKDSARCHANLPPRLQDELLLRGQEFAPGFLHHM